MRIDYLCAVDIGNFDAQRTHILEVAGEMARAGCDLTLILPDFRGERESLPVPSRWLPVRTRRSKVKFVEYELRLAARLWRRWRERRPDCVYLRKGFLTLLPVLLARRMGIPVVVEVNGIVADEVGMAFGLPAAAVRLFARIEAATCRHAAAVVAVTEGLGACLAERYGVAAERIHIIGNGVNGERFAPPPDDADIPFHLGFVGNLAPWAGVATLIRALPSLVAAIPETRCLIVGDGMERTALAALAAELGVGERVTFAGKVAPEAVPDWVRRCRVCVVPAVRRRNEAIGGSSLKLFEYLACGKPAIVSDIRGLDVVAELGVGRVVPAEDSEALAAAAVALLSDGDRLAAMGRLARAVAVERFSWTGVTGRVLAVCEQVRL